ncbi:MAG TPA: glycerate kinase [Saprospiraceae bacterium]|nr:glycerate kinase [Saprospiraceae bacterium]
MQDAISENVKEVILFAGGSATVDAGTGIMQALGLTLLDKNNTAIPTNINALPHVSSLKMDKNKLPKGLDFKIICDVSNPLYGPMGAAQVYGPQKGASEKEVEVLDAGMQHLSTLFGDLGIDIKTEKPGMGAAGGIALATALLNPQLIQGASYFIQKSLLEEHMAKADLIITGEGRYDDQSQMGKITGEIIKRAKDMGKKLVLICGTSNSPLPGANLIRFDQLDLDGEDSFSSPEKYLRLAVRMIEK